MKTLLFILSLATASSSFALQATFTGQAAVAAYKKLTGAGITTEGAGSHTMRTGASITCSRPTVNPTANDYFCNAYFSVDGNGNITPQSAQK